MRTSTNLVADFIVYNPGDNKPSLVTYKGVNLTGYITMVDCHQEGNKNCMCSQCQHGYGAPLGNGYENATIVAIFSSHGDDPEAKRKVQNVMEELDGMSFVDAQLHWMNDLSKASESKNLIPVRDSRKSIDGINSPLRKFFRENGRNYLAENVW